MHITSILSRLFVIALGLCGSFANARPILDVTSATREVSLSITGQATIDFTVRNTSTQPLTVTNVLATGFDQEILRTRLTTNNCLGRLARNATCQVSSRISATGVAGQTTFEINACVSGGAACSGLKKKISVTTGTDGGGNNPTPEPQATIAITAGSPFTLQRDLVAANGSTTTFTITNNSATVTATNIVSDFTGTALDGEVTETANTCQDLAPGGNCTLTFQGGGNNVAQTNFNIAGDNTNTVVGALRVSTLLAYIGNSGFGGNVNICPINVDGTMANCIASNNPGVLMNRAIYVAINAAGTFALVSNEGGNNILSCPINQANGDFSPLPGCVVTAGVGDPHQLTVDANETLATIALSSIHTITVCPINANFTLGACVPNADPGSPPLEEPVSLQFVAGGTRVLMTSSAPATPANRDIIVCNRNPADGTFNACAQEGQPGGAPLFDQPAGMVVNPQQTRIYFANQGTVGGQVTRCEIDNNGNIVGNCVNEAGADGVATGAFRGVAINREGTALYLTDAAVPGTVFRCPIPNPNTGVLGLCVDLAPGGVALNTPEGITLAFVG